MRDGISTSANIRFLLEDLRTSFNNFKTVIDTQIEYFNENTPAENLEASLGLTRQTKALMEGLLVTSDYLGLDRFGDMIRVGNFSEVLGLSEEESDSMSQLLNDFRCLNEANDIAKGIGIEIRKMIIANKERKDRLQQDSTDWIQKGIKRQQEEIKEMEDMSSSFRTHL